MTGPYFVRMRDRATCVENDCSAQGRAALGGRTGAGRWDLVVFGPRGTWSKCRLFVLPRPSRQVRGLHHPGAAGATCTAPGPTRGPRPRGTPRMIRGAARRAEVTLPLKTRPGQIGGATRRDPAKWKVAPPGRAPPIRACHTRPGPASAGSTPEGPRRTRQVRPGGRAHRRATPPDPTLDLWAYPAGPSGSRGRPAGPSARAEAPESAGCPPPASRKGRAPKKNHFKSLQNGGPPT
jgi:hypothetical protein